MPNNTIKTPPIFIMRFKYFLIQFIFPMKSVIVKKGIAKPTLYALIYSIPEPGLLKLRAITDAKIGPIHGVHPAANATPMTYVPIYPLGLLDS